MKTEELEYTVETDNGGRVFADRFDDNALWLSIRTRSGGMNVTMTKQQTQDLIKALEAIVEHL
jgi:hypothetical protein